MSYDVGKPDLRYSFMEDGKMTLDLYAIGNLYSRSNVGLKCH